MKIRAACLDRELIWVLDDVIGDLFSINMKSLETECAIDCKELFPSGKYKVQSLIKWKEDYIVIIPLDIGREWIVFNKISRGIEYRKVVEQKCQERLIAVDYDRNKLYFFPISIRDPAVVVNLNTLRCFVIIKNWSSKLPDRCLETAWTGAYSGKYVFYPQKNTNILVRVDCETQKVDILELAIPESIIDVNYAFGELWVLPIDGNRLYQIDESGLTINTVELIVKSVADSIPNFIRIVVHKRYLFLLPCYRRGIYVYDKLGKETYIIPKEYMFANEEDEEFGIRYWEYCIKNNKICFLPFQGEYIEIDLDNLASCERNLSYPIIWSDGEKIRKCIWSHITEEDLLIRETDECDLMTFLKYLRYVDDMEYLLKVKNMGRELWKRLIAVSL